MLYRAGLFPLQMLLLEIHKHDMEKAKQEQRDPCTILIVTHALTEALFVADRILGLSQYHPKGKEIGSTIVYDRLSLFHPKVPGDCEEFFNQKEEMRKIIFEPTL